MTLPSTDIVRIQDPARALCYALPPDATTAPDWVELLPAGPDIVGRDGRRWTMRDPDAVVAASRIGRDLVFDWEHGSIQLSTAGVRNPAAGWIKELAVRDGALWGRVDWTAAGRSDVETKAYRYLSPVFDFSKSTGEIVRFVSAGLVHEPNLRLPALNREEDTMTLALLCQELGLSATGTMDDVLAAVRKQRQDLTTATNRAENPDITRFIPRADYDAAVIRATNAEKKVAETEAASLKAEVDTLIAGALKEGKITPATEAYYRAACRDRSGVDAFKAFLSTAPAVVAPGSAGTEAKPPAPTGLTDEERAVCRQMGFTEEEWLKANGRAKGGA